MNSYLFKNRNGQTPLPMELRKGLRIKSIQTIGDLDEYEENNILKGHIWLSKQKRKAIDYKFWLLLHKKLFSEVWSWAGKIREHELQNLDFSKPYDIWTHLIKLEKDINYWQEEKVYDLLDIATLLHEKILTIHPFANGNGRFSRILTEYYCLQNALSKPSWGKAFKNDPKKRRENYIDAVIKSRKERNSENLKQFIFG